MGVAGEAAVINSDDVALIRRIAGGDRDALAVLYDRYSQQMLAIAMRMLRDLREAEDVLHDVFMEVWRRAGDYNAERGSVRVWMFVRMRSRTLDRCRSAGRTRTVALDESFAQRISADDPSRTADQQRACAALMALPEPQRQVIELAYFAGLSSSAIAEKLQLPIGTVKSRVAAALNKLRAGLNPTGEV